MARIDLKALPDRIAVGGLIVVVERGMAIAVFHRRCATGWVANRPARQPRAEIAIGDAVACQDRVSDIPIDQIIAGIARNGVITRATINCIGAITALNAIVAVARKTRVKQPRGLNDHIVNLTIGRNSGGRSGIGDHQGVVCRGRGEGQADRQHRCIVHGFGCCADNRAVCVQNFDLESVFANAPAVFQQIEA